MYLRRKRKFLKKFGFSGMFDLPFVDTIKSKIGLFLQSPEKIKKLYSRSQNLLSQLKLKNDNINATKVIAVQESLKILLSRYISAEAEAKKLASGEISFSTIIGGSGIAVDVAFVLAGIKKAEDILNRLEGKTGIGFSVMPVGITGTLFPLALIIGGGIAFWQFGKRKMK